MKLPLSSRRLAAAAAALLTLACGTSPGPRDGAVPDAPLPPLCDSIPRDLGGEVPLEIGDVTTEGFDAWGDGEDVLFEWGPQGGTMITPSFRAPGGLDPAGGAEACVRLEITNRDPSGGMTFKGFESATVETYATRRGDTLVVQDYFDLLGFSSFDRGTPLDLEVVMRGAGGSARGRLQLSLNPPGPILPTDCEALPTEGEGCLYRVYPAAGRVASVAPASPSEPEAVCPAEPEPMVVEVQVALEEPYATCATLEPTGTVRALVSQYFLPSRACLAGLGLVEGSMIEAEYLEEFAGTCSPSMLRFPSLDACAAACSGTP
jgi:hypothetical protein